jgi:hypothetical protein
VAALRQLTAGFRYGAFVRVLDDDRQVIVHGLPWEYATRIEPQFLEPLCNQVKDTTACAQATRVSAPYFCLR